MRLLRLRPADAAEGGGHRAGGPGWMTADDLREITGAQIQATGGRYSEVNARMIDR